MASTVALASGMSVPVLPAGKKIEPKYSKTTEKKKHNT
jgi:hypothetical protein